MDFDVSFCLVYVRGFKIFIHIRRYHRLIFGAWHHALPVLFSHYTDQGISITMVFSLDGLVLSLHHYLSQATEQERVNPARVFAILVAPHPPRLLASPLIGVANFLTTSIVYTMLKQTNYGAYISPLRIRITMHNQSSIVHMGPASWQHQNQEFPPLPWCVWHSFIFFP